MPSRQRVAAKEQSKKDSGRRTVGPSSSSSSTSKEEESGTGSPQPADQQRRKKPSWTPVFKRAACFGLVILIPALLNYAALKQEARMLVPQGGVLYDLGWNQKMLMKCTGSGLPTVILDAPMGHTSDVWALVEPLIAKATRVCVYDRAGLGFSDRAYQNTSQYSNDFSEAARDRDRTKPSTVERMVDDLHRLLSYSSNQPKPVLLVSLDFSTFVSRFYTQLYEHEVAGLLLIDPAFEAIFDARPENENSDSGTGQSGTGTEEVLTWNEYWYKRMVPHAQGVWSSAVIGFNRLSLMLGLMSPVEEPGLVTVLSREVVSRKKYLLCQPNHLTSVFNEYFYANESAEQVKTVFKVKPFPDNIPITVATYKEQPNMEPALAKVWLKGQEQLRYSIHANSKHTVLPGADYVTLFTHPKTVAGAVLTMVHQWRLESKLTA